MQRRIDRRRFRIPGTGRRAGWARTLIATASLETDAAVTPLGIDDPAPRFTWRLTGPGDIRQLSLHVLVASRADLLRPGAADVWDSGEIKSSEPACLYAGPALRARTRYFWTVRVVTNASDGWAEPSWFETGLLSAGDWKGQWIAGPERRGPLSETRASADDGRFAKPTNSAGRFTGSRLALSAALKKNNQGECREIRPAPMFRKTFRVTKPVVGARLYATGLAYQDVAINGRATSNRLLEPAFTNYARDGALHDRRCDGPAEAGRERRSPSCSAPVTSTTPRARGTGAGRMPSGARRPGCGSICACRTPMAPRRSSPPIRRGRSPTGRRASTTTISARPSTLVATCPDGERLASTTTPGRPRAAWMARRECCTPRRTSRSRRSRPGSPARATSRSPASSSTTSGRT